MIKKCLTCDMSFTITESHSLYGSLLCKKIGYMKIIRSNITNKLKREKRILSNKKYYTENRKNCIESMKKYQKENPLIKKKIYRNYINKHREKELKRLREWKRNNKEKHSLMNKIWKAKNKHKVKMYKIKRKNNEQKINFTEKDWKAIKKKQNQLCFYCDCRTYKKGEIGFKKTNEQTMEHLISLDMGGKTTKNNIVLSCLSCNSSKQNKSFEEFIKYKNES